jgi:2-iminobutanoate/2-iminopropanoate deaminase
MSANRETIHLSPRASNAASGQAASAVAKGGDFLFVCGLIAVDLESGQPVRGTTAGETRQILANLKEVLEAAGSSLDKVVKMNVLLASMVEAPAMNEVYRGFFLDPPPARTVCAARLPNGMKVMIECTALA